MVPRARPPRVNDIILYAKEKSNILDIIKNNVVTTTYTVSTKKREDDTCLAPSKPDLNIDVQSSSKVLFCRSDDAVWT